ncbi:hypothetical protein Tamer19_25590 [Cupriavidus sp. TA19]|nr:hypothetical protein Tamer19_25590 [Cupriavidus sp. TA19]
MPAARPAVRHSSEAGAPDTVTARKNPRQPRVQVRARRIGLGGDNHRKNLGGDGSGQAVFDDLFLDADKTYKLA